MSPVFYRLLCPPYISIDVVLTFRLAFPTASLPTAIPSSLPNGNKAVMNSFALLCNLKDRSENLFFALSYSSLLKSWCERNYNLSISPNVGMQFQKNIRISIAFQQTAQKECSRDHMTKRGVNTYRIVASTNMSRLVTCLGQQHPLLQHKTRIVTPPKT